MSNEFVGFANEVDPSEYLASLGGSLVKVIHGSADGTHPIGGATVASARESLASTYNIPTGAKAFVDGVEVGDDFVLGPNSSLEFIMQAGVKGNFGN